MPKLLYFLSLALLLPSCEKTSRVGGNYIDSLVTANVGQLAADNARLEKFARVGNRADTAALAPDSTAWSNELDVFRQIGSFQKPAYRDAYQIVDGLKDAQSNLSVKEYKAASSVPVPLVRFYYFDKLHRLKKIEAHVNESNTLYSATRKLILEFDERGGKAVLTHYSLDGIQRMILNDSLTYSIEGKIIN